MSEFLSFPCPASQEARRDGGICQGRMLIANNLLRDAARETLPANACEDCAFDAGYLFALALIGLEAAEAFMHPDIGVLLAAADKLAWPHSAMAPAISHLESRYSPGRDGSASETMVRWAFEMKAAVDAACPRPMRIAGKESDGV